MRSALASWFAGRDLASRDDAAGQAPPSVGRTGPRIRGFVAVDRTRRRGWSLVAVIIACLSAGIAACSNDTGYVEIRTGSPVLGPPPSLYLDAVKVEPRNGSVVLRERVGTAKLRIGAGAQQLLLCEVVVKKNRITTVTLSLIDRPPRCQCRTDVTADQRGGRVCIG